MAVLLMTEPSGARLPTGKQTVEVRPRSTRAVGRHDHVIGIDAVALASICGAGRARRSLSLPPVEAGIESVAGDGLHAGVEQPGRAQMQHHFRHAAGEKYLTVAKPRGPLGSASTRRGTSRFTCSQSARVGRRNPAEKAMAGRCRSKFVDPPKAACSTMALRTAPSVSTSRTPSFKFMQPEDCTCGALCRVEPDGLAGGCERGMRQGQSQRLADDLRSGRGAEKLASAAGRCAGAASHFGRVFQRDLLLRKARADGLHFARILARLGQERDAAGDQHRGQRACDASAIIIAGRPLSQVATPSTPLRVGSERMSRRSTMAASLRNGSESIMPVVPCVRPSQGSVQAPAKGAACSGLQLARGFGDQQADFPVAGVKTERDGLPIFSAHAAVRAENEELGIEQPRGLPAHAGVLGEAEEISRWRVEQHLRASEAAQPAGPRRACRDIAQCAAASVSSTDLREIPAITASLMRAYISQELLARALRRSGCNRVQPEDVRVGRCRRVDRIFERILEGLHHILAFFRAGFGVADAHAQMNVVRFIAIAHQPTDALCLVKHGRLVVREIDSGREFFGEKLSTTRRRCERVLAGSQSGDAQGLLVEVLLDVSDVEKERCGGIAFAKRQGQAHFRSLSI